MVLAAEQDRRRAGYWRAYRVGERVEVDLPALRLRPRDPVLFAAGRAVCGAGYWQAAVVEGVRRFPGYDGFERYAVRLRDGAFAGLAGEVGVAALRPPPGSMRAAALDHKGKRANRLRR